jgi:hypothetical protein
MEGITNIEKIMHKTVCALIGHSYVGGTFSEKLLLHTTASGTEEKIKETQRGK